MLTKSTNLRAFLITYFFIFYSLVGSFAQANLSYAAITTKSKGYVGYFPFYYDENQGKIWLEVSRLQEEFLYVTSLPAGLGSNDIGLDRGKLGEERVVYFEKIGKKLLLVQPNLKYRAVSNDSNERRAIDQSFAKSILWGFEIAAQQNGKYLIDITSLLMSDIIGVTKQLAKLKEGTYKLEPSRSAFFMDRTKNFPNNSEFEVTQTFVGGDDAGKNVISVTPTPTAVSLRVHHSFVKLPEPGFEMRPFDPRSSFYALSYMDYATPVTEPILKHFTVRHRLAKKDPTAAISDPVKPIIYYLDNGTPEPIRSALLDGARWWNQAFEAAGYRNAFQVKILPDDADPMDCRYNVINWVHRSTRGWSYGSNVMDPRTGEIIKGHVTLGSLRVRQDYLIAQGLLSPFENGKKLDPDKDPMLKMALQRLRQLAAHEVGHTLGLQHNYAASIDGRASVMDYPHPKIDMDSNGNLTLNDAYTNEIGIWDKAAITWGYQDFAKGTDTNLALDQIIDKANKAGLHYLPDQDARPAGSLSATAHLWDGGNDPVAELQHLIKVREKALSKFGENTLPNGTQWAQLEDALVPIYNLHRYQVEAVAKIIGAQNYNLAIKGDGQKPIQNISKDYEMRALEAALQCLEPGFLQIPDRIGAMIMPRPYQYESKELFNRRTGLSFDPLAAAEAAANFPLMFLFNSQRASRMIQHEAAYGNLGLESMINKVVDATFKAKKPDGLPKMIALQTEQIVLTHLLALSINDASNYQVRAICGKVLKELKTWLEDTKKTSQDSSYLAHIDHALERMKNPSAAKVNQHKELPPGAPIGCDEN